MIGKMIRIWISRALLAFLLVGAADGLTWPQVPQGANEIYDLRGNIMMVSPAERTILVREVTVFVTDTTWIGLGEQPGSFSDLKSGTQVGIIGRKSRRGLDADLIKILSSPRLR